MGKVILCAGRKADKPYVIQSVGINAETIEELCYCLRQNLDLIDSGAIDRNMAAFIKDDLGLSDRGRLLESLIFSRASLKDKLMTIFESCDYYDAAELKKISSEIDEISRMSNIERRKKRADKLMHNGKINEAASEYRVILDSPTIGELSDVSKGCILHNLAIYEIRRGDLDEAAGYFLNAYEHNGNPESLKSYLYSLKLAKNNTRYADEIKRLEVDLKVFNEVENKIHLMEENFEESTNYNEINRLKVLWQQGRYSEEKRLSAEIIDRLKLIYRRENE